MIIDCNVGFGHWPFARFAEDTPAKLDRLLSGDGIDVALVSSAEAVLFEEPEETNRDLAGKLRRYPRLSSVPVVNPRLIGSSTILATRGIRAVKLIPNYHCYSLRDEAAVALCSQAAERGLPVLVQVRVEDERSHYELLKVPGVPADDIIALARGVPKLTVVALCPYFAEVVKLCVEPRVYADISMVETLDTLGQLCAKVPAEKVLFGSHAPWLYPRAAVAKLRLSSIKEEEREAIGWRTASRVFGIASG